MCALQWGTVTVKFPARRMCLANESFLEHQLGDSTHPAQECALWPVHPKADDARLTSDDWQHPPLPYSSQPDTWAGVRERQQPGERSNLAYTSLCELGLLTPRFSQAVLEGRISSFCLTHLTAVYPACTPSSPSQSQRPPPHSLVTGKAQSVVQSQAPVTL